MDEKNLCSIVDDVIATKKVLEDIARGIGAALLEIPTASAIYTINKVENLVESLGGLAQMLLHCYTRVEGLNLELSTYIPSLNGDKASKNPPLKILKLPFTELEFKRIGKEELTDLIAEHYHKLRTKVSKIDTMEFKDSGMYAIEMAAKVLSLTTNSLGSRTNYAYFEGKGMKREISGYEIVRLYQRPRANYLIEKADFLKKFKLDPDVIQQSEIIYQRLVDLGIIVEKNVKGDLRLDGIYVQDFFDKIFPMKASDRYDKIKDSLPSF